MILEEKAVFFCLWWRFGGKIAAFSIFYSMNKPEKGKGLEKWQAKKFEDIKHLDEHGNEYWLARELQSVLDYAQWRRFCDAIDRAMLSCKLNKQDPKYHFAETTKTTEIGGRTKKTQNVLEFANAGKFYSKQEKLE
jgi:hypothetical protein